MGKQGARLALSASLIGVCVAMLVAGAASASVNLRRVQPPSLATLSAPASVTPASSATSYPSTNGTAPPPLYVDGQAIVRFEGSASAAKRKSLHKLAGATVIRKLLLPDTYLVRFDPQRKPKDVAAQYKRDATVRYAEPNYLRHVLDTLPNDPSFGELWGLHNVGQTVNGTPGTAGADIGVTGIWDGSTGSDNVTVGVVDTGVDYNHSDLAPNIYVNTGEIALNGIDDDSNGVIDDRSGYDFLGVPNPDPVPDTDPMDTSGHGTHIAGIIGARGNNAIGVTGVAWRVKIAPLRVCDEIGCTDAGIADAFTYAGREGIPIINASLGRDNDPTEVGPLYSNTVSAAIAASPNTLFVTAAGNGGDDEVGDNNETTPQFPCNYTAANVLCVAATDRNDHLASFSNYGATSVDVAAPGQYILSTWKRESGQDRYAFQSGSSQSTAMVSGAAALDLAQNPTATTATLKNDITGNAESLPDLTGKVASGGRLDLSGSTPDPTPPSPPAGLDTSFNGTGKTTLQVPGSTGTNWLDVALQPDGKIVVGGYANVGNYDFAVARLNANGTMDTTFSGDGFATASFGAANDFATALALQSDGKIVLSGSPGLTDFGVARFNTNGTLDTTFDGDGMARTDTGLQDLANGTAIQSDGKIVLVGTRQSADLQVMRYNTNGSLDTTFDGDGILQTDLGTSNEELHDVAIQSDGKILGVGGTFPFGPSPGDFALVRYNSNGALDTSFDGDGKVFTDWGGRADSSGESANAVTIQSNGRIVVAGQVPDATTTQLWRFAVARYLTNGSLDGSFDGDGKATMNVAGDNQPSTSGDVSADDVALVPSGGQIVVAGWSYPASFVETVARFNPDGTPDTTFGQNGLANPSTCASPIGKLTGVAIQPNRRMVLAGHSCASPAGTAPVARLNGSSATITVTPNVEMNASGQTVEVHGAQWPEDTTVQIQQCNETNPASPVCVTVATAYTGFPGFGGFFATDNENPPSLTYASTGGSCPDPVCKIVVTAPNGEVVKAPISFKSTTSMSAAPSRGAIAQADAIQVGQTITVKAILSGGATAPIGSVSFFWCGPLLHPTTCAAGGTSFGSQPLTGTGGNGATATSGTVSFASPGRYCFRVTYPGDGTHRSATDSSRESCVSVRAAPGVGPLGADDFFEGIAGLQIQVGAPGVLQNDLSGPGLTPTAQLVAGPTSGSLIGGLAANGSFTYQPNNGSVTSDSFTYRAQDTSGLSDIVTVKLDLTGSSAVNGTRYKGTRYHGTRYKGTRYHGTRYKGTRYKGTRYKSLNDAAMITYGECGPRWVWVNPQITFYEQTTAEITAALYSATGARIASSEGFLADGEFYGDLSDPLNVSWPVWNTPAPAGGVYAKVFLVADPADPAHANYTLVNTVGCQT